MTPVVSQTPVLPNQSQSPDLAARVIDTINPLQHIPFVSFIYREITGDQITPDARFAGGMLYGGPIGALGAVAGMIAGGALSALTGSETVKSAFGMDDAAAETPHVRLIDPWKFNE